jgi:aspartyl protease family protein
MRFLGVLSALLVIPNLAVADTRVNVVGLFSGKALLVINGGAPRTLAVGQTSPEGVKLLAADSTQAVLEVEGKRKELGMGQGASVAGAAASSAPSGMTLYASRDGHFFGEGSINGKPIKFLVDTGATSVSMSSAEARRLGIDYVAGHEAATSTAAGVVKAWVVTLNSVKLGGVVLNQVEGNVIDGDSPPFVLMGMSALIRLDMKRDGMTMTLTKKY